MSTIPAVLRAAAAQTPDREAVVTAQERLTFSALLDRARAFSAAALASGIRPGDRVAIWGPNTVNWIVASLGLTFPLLRGDETIVLHGMDHAQPALALQLPAERPRFAIAGLEAKPVTPPAELHLVLIDVDARRLTLVWAGRHRGAKLPAPPQLPTFAANVAVTWSAR